MPHFKLIFYNIKGSICLPCALKNWLCLLYNSAWLNHKRKPFFIIRVPKSLTYWSRWRSHRKDQERRAIYFFSFVNNSCIPSKYSRGLIAFVIQAVLEYCLTVQLYYWLLLARFRENREKGDRELRLSRESYVAGAARDNHRFIFFILRPWAGK